LYLLMRLRIQETKGEKCNEQRQEYHTSPS
jgi:hypothetical protein